MFMLPHVEVNDLFMSLRRLEKQTRMYTLTVYRKLQVIFYQLLFQ